MGLFDAITDFFAEGRYARLSQTQTEAVIDALTYALVPDGEVADSEKRELTDALEEFEWEGDVPIDTYVDEAIDYAESVLDDEAQAEEYARDIAERIGDDAVQEETYFLAAKLAIADRGILESERVYLQRLVEAFDIDRRRLAVMTRELMRDVES